MTNKETLISMIDELPPDDLEEVYQHIKLRRQVVSFHLATGTHHAVVDTTTREPAETIRDEVNAIINAAINVVRQKRETQEATEVHDKEAIQH